MPLSLKELVVLRVIADHNRREKERIESRGYPVSIAIPCTSGILRDEVDRFVKENNIRFKTPRGKHGLEVHVEEVERAVRELRKNGLVYYLPDNDPGVQRFAQTTHGDEALGSLPNVADWTEDNVRAWANRYGD